MKILGKTIQFKVTLKLGPKVVTEFTGREMDPDLVKIGDVLALERTVEVVTGYRCHVQAVE